MHKTKQMNRLPTFIPSVSSSFVHDTLLCWCLTEENAKNASFRGLCPGITPWRRSFGTKTFLTSGDESLASDPRNVCGNNNRPMS